MDSVIVPIPSKVVGTCAYEDVGKFYLSGIETIGSLHNEQNKNTHDERYNVYQDKGSFFTQMDSEYQAKKHEVNNDKVKEGISAIFTAGIDIAIGFVPGVSDMVTYVSYTQDFVEAISDQMLPI